MLGVAFYRRSGGRARVWSGGKFWSSETSFPPTAMRRVELQDPGGIIAYVSEVAGAREGVMQLEFVGGGQPSATCST